MKGYECKKCKTELEYEQVQGMRVKKYNRNDKLYYTSYCPKCKEYNKEIVPDINDFNEYYKLLISMATDQLIGKGISELVFINNLRMIVKMMDEIYKENSTGEK